MSEKDLGLSLDEETEHVAGLELESEFEHVPVPMSHRKSYGSVAAVWFGFPMVLTSAIFGGVIVAFLGFWVGVAAILIGNIVLSLYVGTLSYLAGASGRNFALQATQTFGRTGYKIASGFLATIVTGWFAFQTGLTGATVSTSFGWNETAVIIGAGILYVAVTFIGVRALSVLGLIAAPLYVLLGIVAVVITGASNHWGELFAYCGIVGTAGVAPALTFGGAVTIIIAGFADSGTMTGDFTRWSKNGPEAVLATLSAFPVANFIAQMFGAVIVAAGVVAEPTKNGGSFLPVLAHGGAFLSLLALIFVFVNLGSVCTHCLYNGAVGWSHIVGGRMRTLTVILGIVGIVAAVAGVWNLFLGWLSILGVFVPPIGAIIITDQLILRRFAEGRAVPAVRQSAFVAWAIGALAAGIVHFEAPAYADSVVGMVVGGLAYYIIQQVAQRRFAQPSAVQQIGN